MHAERMLQRRLLTARVSLDPRWWRSIWDAVGALILGRVLQLTRMGRFSRRPTTQKHRIKAMDRLLSSTRVFTAAGRFYKAVAAMLIGSSKQVRVLVDWTQMRGSLYAIVAAVPVDGRAIPILSQVYDHARRPTRRMHRRFLDALESVLPSGCIPTLITDAGFQGTWLQDVEAHGWRYLARLRHRTCVRPVSGGQWVRNKLLHASASRAPRDLGLWEMGKDRPNERMTTRLILARRSSTHRHRKGPSGVVLSGGISVYIRAQNREPWLLATNVHEPAAEVVLAYALRMKIEQVFRDTKSAQLGLALEHMRSHGPRRLEVLLLIATLGILALVLVGLAARDKGLHRQLQANTSTRAVHSVFQIGLLLCTTVAGLVSLGYRDVSCALSRLTECVACSV